MKMYGKGTRILSVIWGVRKEGFQSVITMLILKKITIQNLTKVAIQTLNGKQINACIVHVWFQQFVHCNSLVLLISLFDYLL